MSTNDSSTTSKKDIETKPKEENKLEFFFAGGSPDSMTSLIDAMNSVDLQAPQAKLNETSISDGSGGRIELNLDKDLIHKK